MSFLELLEKQGDKVTLTEMILAKKSMPERVKDTIPGCIYLPLPKGEPEGTVQDLDLEVLGILSWIIARRENPEITIEEVGDRIGIGVEGQIKKIVKEVTYFYTTLTREFIEELYSPDASEVEDENPTPEAMTE